MADGEDEEQESSLLSTPSAGQKVAKPSKGAGRRGAVPTKTRPRVDSHAAKGGRCRITMDIEVRTTLARRTHTAG